MEENLKKLGEELAKDLNDRMEKSNEQVKNIGEAHEETKTELENIKQMLVEEAEAKKAAETEKEGLQKRLDEFEANMKTLAEKNANVDLWTSKTDEVFESEEFKSLVGGKSKGFSFDLGLKAGDMTSGNTLTGDVVNHQRVAGVVSDPHRKVRIRSLLPVGTASTESIRHTNESANDDGTASRAEGGTMGQSDFDLQEVTTNAKHISAYATLSREMLEDNDFLRSYLNQFLVDFYMDEEDNQILNQSGAGNDVDGLINNATAYADELADTDVTHYDVLASCVKQINEDNFSTNRIIIPWEAYLDLVLAKDDQGMYLYPADIRTGGSISVMGIPVSVTSAIADDNFLVGDMRAACTLFDRRKMQVEMWLQDGNNPRSREVTFTINGSIILPIYKGTAMRTGTFVNALATGSA